MKRIAACVLCIILVLSGCARFAGSENVAPEVTEEQLGREVRVAIIDTGISSAAIAPEHVAEGANYLIPENGTEDTYGHGTAIASVILAHSKNAVLVPLVSNVYDRGRISFVDNATFAQMIRDAVDIYNCEIINISAGLVLDKEPIRQAVAYAEEQGVLIVASAGNDYLENPGQIYYPAAYETVLAVGALTADGTQIADFAQRGPWVDLFAPGEEIPYLTLSGGNGTGKGSSYAAAQVTAAAVGYLQKNGSLSPKELRALLTEEAESYGALANANKPQGI